MSEACVFRTVYSFLILLKGYLLLYRVCFFYKNLMLPRPFSPPPVRSSFSRNSRERERITPDPAGFTDLFAPNTSSILSVESSTPGDANPSSAMLHTAPSSGEAGLKTSGSGSDKMIGDNNIMPPPAVPREGDFVEVSPLKPGSGRKGADGAESSDEPGSGSKRKRGSGRRGEERDDRARLQEALGVERMRWGLMLEHYVALKREHVCA